MLRIQRKVTGPGCKRAPVTFWISEVIKGLWNATEDFISGISISFLFQISELFIIPLFKTFAIPSNFQNSKELKTKFRTNVCDCLKKETFSSALDEPLKLKQ